jgi:predicted Zn finger-like uncharacterized protein
MSIAFDCPQCGKAFRVDAGAAGKKARCKRCGLLLEVPRVSGQTPIVYGTPVDDPPPRSRTPAPAPARPREPPRPKPKAPPAVVDPYGLEEAAADPGFEVLDDDEPMPSARARDRERGGRGWSWGDVAGSQRRIGMVVGGLAALVLGVWLFWPWSRAVVEPTPGPATMTGMPERRSGREVAPGVVCHEMVFGRGQEFPGMYPGSEMTLWLYLPAGEHAPGSLPCVLIAPAGSIVITGMALGDGDRDEHLPWARAGFAVLAYSLDGDLPRERISDVAAIRQASAAFRLARGGLSNAEIALEWLSKKAPEVDSRRIYTVGHSSAGTAALLVAEHNARIKACVAFAPAVDYAGNFGFAQRLLLRSGGVSWLDEFFTTYDPKHHAAEMRGPVYLFQATDDSVVPVSRSQSFADDLKRLGKPVTFVTVPTGGHYDAMIEEGVPRAIEWVRGLDRGR